MKRVQKETEVSTASQLYLAYGNPPLAFSVCVCVCVVGMREWNE